jgi:hypothetical protein
MEERFTLDKEETGFATVALAAEAEVTTDTAAIAAIAVEERSFVDFFIG